MDMEQWKQEIWNKQAGKKVVSEEQRRCVFCDLGVVEDEFHFVFSLPCILYRNLRNHLRRTLK